MTDHPGLTWNKALGASLGGVMFGALGPMLLGALNWVHPIAGAFNPVLGGLVGVGVFVMTYFTKKNAEPKAVQPPVEK